MYKCYKLGFTVKRFILLILLCYSLTSFVYCESNLKKISDNLYMINGFGGNIAFLVAEESILVVDGGYKLSDGKQVLEIIKNVSDKPIEYVVMTHYHRDHVTGIQEFCGSAQIIASDNCTFNLSNRGQENLKDIIDIRYPKYITKLDYQIANHNDNSKKSITELKESLNKAELQLAELKTVHYVNPDIIFYDSLLIDMGNEQIMLHFLGPGHTSGNIIVQFKVNKTIHMGDLLFNNLFTYVDFEDGSDTENWIKILKTVSTWEQKFVIPGHGDLLGPESIKEQIGYLTDLRAAVSQAITSGKSLKEAKNEIELDEYDSYNWPENLPVGVEAVYKEMMAH